jgi:hypothetical protein
LFSHGFCWPWYYQGKDIVFRFIIEYSSLMDFGPYQVIIIGYNNGKMALWGEEKKSHFVHMTLPFLINIGFNWSMSSIPT